MCVCAQDLGWGMVSVCVQEWGMDVYVCVHRYESGVWMCMCVYRSAMYVCVYKSGVCIMIGYGMCVYV